jgi:hypothetical protein
MSCVFPTLFSGIFGELSVVHWMHVFRLDNSKSEIMRFETKDEQNVA